MINNETISYKVQNNLEDFLLATEIIKKAISLRPDIKEAVSPNQQKDLSNEDRIHHLFAPTRSFFFVDEDKILPALLFRFAGEESPLCEMFFHPLDYVLLYINEARRIVKCLYFDEEEKERDRVIFNYSLDMTLLLIDTFYHRMELSFDYLPFEIVGQWHQTKHLEALELKARAGEKVTNSKDPYLLNVLESLGKDIRQFWKYQNKLGGKWRNTAFAEEYNSVFKHWLLLLKIASDDSYDLKDYARAGKFKDTPDDLLDNLENMDRSNNDQNKKISEIALEHAARRVGIFKKTSVSEHIRNKRKAGIVASGYSPAQLFNFLEEGREVLNKINAKRKVV